jgi:3-hydroxyisobutyrate dehydrogenase-like beta-hydroxyacid dehydrogenase
MKLVNNLIAAASLAVTAEAMVMGVKAGLDAQGMIMFSTRDRVGHMPAARSSRGRFFRARSTTDSRRA